MSRVRLHAATFMLLTLPAVPAAGQVPDTTARSLAATCFTCHGTDGRSVGGVPPALAGRDRAELAQQLKDFKAGKRPATIMHQHAKGYTDAQIDQLAAYFAAVPASVPATPSRY
jgi:cytochrome subunit of sulfide dehydrogenase